MNKFISKIAELVEIPEKVPEVLVPRSVKAFNSLADKVGIKPVNRYIEKLAGISVARVGRRLGRLGKGALGVASDFAETASGKNVYRTMREGTKVKVTNPITKNTYHDTISTHDLAKLDALSDSEKIQHLTNLHGRTGYHVQKLKKEINKRDAARVAVGGTAAVVLAKNIKNKLEERRAYNQYYQQ